MNKLFIYYFCGVFLFLVFSHSAWMVPQSSAFYKCDYYWVEEDNALSIILKNVESNRYKGMKTTEIFSQDLFWHTEDFFENNNFRPQIKIEIESIRFNEYSYNATLYSDNEKVFVVLSCYEKEGTWYPFAVKNNIVESIWTSSFFADHAFSGFTNVKHNIWRLIYSAYGAFFFQCQLFIYIVIFIIGWLLKKCIEE